MELNMKTVNHVTVVDIIGEVDGKTAQEIQEQMLPHIHADSKTLLDMSRVEYMSSAGLRMLLLIYRQIKGSAGRIVLVGVSDEIRDIMSATGFLSHFSIYPTVDEGFIGLQEEQH
jgi:anti-sigma B factor antagonist